MSSAPFVVKVGGSLFDLPDLGGRLGAWLSQLSSSRILLVPGGGATANVVRAIDRQHGLGEEAAHWLALRAQTLNAFFLASLVSRPVLQVVPRLEDCEQVWHQGRVPVLDAHAFATADEGQAGCLPHAWSVTSDSLAARVALVAGAASLILLKSVRIPPGLPWSEAGQHGYVDSYFAEMAGKLPSISTVNLREWRP
jgi:aspartokinase-like uncharacterized kinase